MVRVFVTTCLLALCVGDAKAGGCRRCYNQAIVQKAVAIKYVEPQVLYFVNPPQVQPSYNYAEVRQANYNQIERQFQRLAEQMEDMAAQEQAYAPQQYYAPPQQYAAPQQQYAPQQVQQSAPTCQGQAAPQQEPCPTCNQPAEEVPAQEPIDPNAGPPQQEPGPPPVPNPPTSFNMQGPTPALANRCAKCHGPGTQHEKQFSLEGPMTWQKARKIAEEVNTGNMPRDAGNNPAPLGDQERAQLFEELVNAL